MVAWAFSLAAAGLFAPLVMGIWWKQTNAAGAVTGMLAGFGLCLFYLVGTRYAPVWWVSTFGSAESIQALQPLIANVSQAAAAIQAAGATVNEQLVKALSDAQAALTTAALPRAHWWGIRNISSALFGLPVAFIVTWIVSLMTQAPSKEMQEFVDSIRTPKGEVAWSGKAHE
jgi:cation/acetate symporter